MSGRIGFALALAASLAAAPVRAGPSVGDALRLCRSDPSLGDSLRMSVEDALRRSQGEDPDEADVDELLKLAQDTATTQCMNDLARDGSVFRALNGLSGFAAESGWDAWRHQCKGAVGPAGPCIEAEGRAGEDLRRTNQDRSAQTVYYICGRLLERAAGDKAADVSNRARLECLRSGLAARPTPQALEACKFVDAEAGARPVDAVVRCFRDRAK